MLEGFVEQYLLRYLGDYIFGVDKQNLSVTTWRGEIHLRSARLKQEVVELLNLPFQLFFGEVDSCLINVPWNRLGSRPVTIELSGLRVLLGPKPASAWSNEEELRRVQLARQKILDRADLVFGLKQGDPEPESQGYLGRLLTRIGDNLELHLRDLHIRFQDDEPPSGRHPVAGGIHVDSVEVQTAGPDWEPSFVQRAGNEIFKVLRLRDLSCYHVLPGWAYPLKKEELSDEDFRRFFRGTPEQGSWPEAFQHLKQLHRVRHVVPPLSATLWLTQAIEMEPKKPQFDLMCEVKKIQVLLSSSSYQGICGIMSLVSEYFAFQEVTRHWIQRYWLYRPSVGVHNNAALWWRYSLCCIRAAGIQTVRPSGNARVDFCSLLEEDALSRLRLQAEYVALVVRSRGGQGLADEEQARLQRLQVALQLPDLLWGHAAALEVLKAQLSETAERSSRWSLWARAAPPSKVISVPLPMAAVEAGAAADVALAPNSARSWTPKADAEKEEPRGAVTSFAEELTGSELLPEEELAFRYLPSVGSWLILRPSGIALEDEGGKSEDEVERLADETPRAGGWDSMLDSEGSDEGAVSEEAEDLDFQNPPPRAAPKVRMQDDYRFRPSVGTWLQPKPFVVTSVASEKSWLAWLLPSRFAADAGAGPARAAASENPQSSSTSSWLTWSRLSWTRSTARPQEAGAAAAPAVQTAQATSSLSSWLSPFRSRGSESAAPGEPPPAVEAPWEQEERSSSAGSATDSPSRRSSSASSSTSGRESRVPEQPPSWRVWFSPGAGTAPPAPVDDAAHLEALITEKRYSGFLTAMAFTEAVALAPTVEAPLLKLQLRLPEVVVEMQMEHSQTIGSAELHLTLHAGEELSLRAEVATMSLTVRRDGVDARLVHLSPLADGSQERKAMSVEYISRDEFGQPWVAIQAQGLVLLFQQELIQEVANSLAQPRAVKKSQRGFDRWRRRAKALLYTRGRPRLQLQLQEQVLLLPTRARFGGPLLSLRTRSVEAVSCEVSDGLCGECDGDMQIVRVDRWTVDARGLQLLYFSAYDAYRARLPEWTLIQDLSLHLSCLAKKQEEVLAPARSAFGAAAMPKVAHGVEVSGEIPALILSVDADAYEALLRVVRRLLNSSSQRGEATKDAQPPPSPVPPMQSDDDDFDAFAETPGQPSITFRRSRFLSASSEAASPQRAATGRRAPTVRAEKEDAFGMRGRPTVSFTGNVGTLSVRFHCLPTAFDHIELTGPKAVLSFRLFQGSASIGVDVSSLSLLGPPLPGGSRLRLAHAEPASQAPDARVVLGVVAAWEDKAKAAESENADLRISLDLGIAKFRFSPWHFREFISFAKTTPPPDVVPIPLPGNPLQWRIRVTFREGELQWIDEATNKLFAVSRMQQSTVLLDLHQDTICFRSGLQNFTIQDQLSSRTPMILEYRQKAGYVLEINARTFLPKSLEFRGYQTEVSIRFQSVHLQYMGQKFLQCWQWIFGAFLPAVTAGRRQPPPRQSPPSEDTDSCASFKSIEEDGDVPPPPRPPSLSRQASISPAQPAAANFVELAEGELAQESAWQAAEQVLRKAASDKDARLPALTRLRIFFDDLVVSVPLELGGRSEMPAVELRARSLVVSNGPGRRSGREALIDALALSARQVELWEVPVETRLLAPQDMTIHIDLNLQVQKPPLPMHVLWYASSAQWQLSSRGLALLRAGFSRNIAGIDPDIESQVTPDQNQLLHPQKYPIWLIFRLLWRNFRWQFQEEAKTFAELAAKQLVVEVKKHAAPRAQVSFSLWEARLTADEVPVALLMGRRPCAKAAARSGGRKGGASIHGEYISDHAKGQSFEIDGHRQRLLLLRPLLRRCWGFLFPKKPWFPPPPVMGARPSEELRVVATLPEAHILLVEKLQLKTAPLISVLTGLRYQLQSRSGVQWWLNFHGLEVIRCQSREAALELDGREDPSGCQLLTTEKHEVEFRVANAAAPPAEAAEGAPAPTETSASRLLVKALRLRVSNNDLRLLVTSYRAAWGEDEEAPPEQFAVTEHVLEYRIPDVRVVLLSEHDTGPRNPFLDICGSDWVYVRCLRHLAPGANAESRVTGKARISIQLFNPNVGTFEPLLEGQETSTDAESEVAPGDRKWGIKVTRSSGPAPPSLPSTPTASVSAEENAGKFQPLREVIAVDCPEPLLLNATDAFWRTLPRHSMWLSLWRGGAEADESVVKEVLQSSDDFAPYAVRNDLGVPVLLRFPDKPSPLRLAPGAEQRLDAGKEEGEAAEGRPKRPVLAVQLETAGPVSFDEVGEITIDRLGRAVHPLVRSCGVAALTRSSRSYQGNQAMLAGLVEQQNARLSSRLSKEHMTRAASQPRLSRGGGDAADAGCLPLPYLVARVRAKEAYKLLLLESPVHVVNQLSVPVQLRLSATELPDEIPPLGAAPLPANLDVRDQLAVRPSRRRGAPWSRNFKLEQLLLGPPDGAFRSHNPVAGKPGTGSAGEVAGCAFCLVWKMESIHVQGAPDARQWTLSLHAPVTVVSSLPVPFTVEVRGAGAAPLRETLQPGKKREIHSLPGSELELRVTLFGPDRDCWSPTLQLRAQHDAEMKVPLAVPVDEAGKQHINILIVMSWQLLEKPVVIAVHSPSWIADHVRSEQLRFIYPRQERTSSRMPGSSFSRMPDLCYVPLPPDDDVAGDPLAPRMLPLDCDATRIAVRLRQTESQALSLQAIQACTVQMAAKKEPDDNDQEPDFVFLGVRNTLQFTRIGDLSLEVRVVHVAPAQVAVNATGRPLNLRQSSRPRGQGAGINVSKQVVSVPSGRRAAIHWSSPGKEPLWIRVQIADSPRWRWSGKLRVGEVGEYSFQCCAEHPNQWEIENLRVEVRSEEATTYFIFRLGSEATAPILLRNFSSEPILIQQASSDMSDEDADENGRPPAGRFRRWLALAGDRLYGGLPRPSPPVAPEAPAPRSAARLLLEPQAKRPWAWAEPALEKRRLEIRSANAESLVMRLEVEKTGKSVPLLIGSSIPLFYDVGGAGHCLVFTVREDVRESAVEVAGDAPSNDFQVDVNVAGIGISLVAAPNTHARRLPDFISHLWNKEGNPTVDEEEPVRRELLFFTADRLKLAYRRTSAAQETVELKIHEVQIDNQRDDAPHPVLLCRRREGKEDAEPLFHLFTSRRRWPQDLSYVDFERFELFVRPLDLKLDEGFILDMLALAPSIRDSLSGATSTAESNDASVEKEGVKLHFRHLLIDKVCICTSFASARSQWPGRPPGDAIFWRRLLKGLSSIDRHKFRLDGYTKNRATLDWAALGEDLRGHYLRNLKFELSFLIGGLDVLGAPSTSCGSIYLSCKEGLLSTYKGAMEHSGGAGMMEGCIEGSHSCFRNAFFECFNSASKASGAAQQCCRICLDEEPRRATQAPQHPRDGCVSGCQFCAVSVGRGVRGLYLRPASGYQASGVCGLAKGAGRGTLGCVAEAFVGCLEATRLVTEGIRNTAKVREEARRRLPRPLYGMERALRSYDPGDAELKAALVALDPLLRDSALVSCVRDSSGKVVVVVSDSFILFLHPDHRKFSKVSLQEIAEVEIRQEAPRPISSPAMGFRRQRSPGEVLHLAIRPKGALHFKGEAEVLRAAARLLAANVGQSRAQARATSRSL